VSEQASKQASKKERVELQKGKGKFLFGMNQEAVNTDFSSTLLAWCWPLQSLFDS